MSVRCKNFEPALDVAAYEGLKLRVLGNGLRYKCIIRCDSSWDGVGYCRCGIALKSAVGGSWFVTVSSYRCIISCDSSWDGVGCCRFGTISAVCDPVGVGG